MFKKSVLRQLTVWSLILGGVAGLFSAGLFSAGPVLAQGKGSVPVNNEPNLGAVFVDGTFGARIEAVSANSLAASLNLQPDDRITAVDGLAVDSEHPLQMRLYASGIQAGLTLTVVRQGQTLTLRVTQAGIDAASGGAALRDRLSGVIEPQTVNGLSDNPVPANRANQPTIGQRMSSQLNTRPNWTNDLVGTLGDFFASLKADMKSVTPSTN